jgi:RND family efflux transporter MFP subunit
MKILKKLLKKKKLLIIVLIIVLGFIGYLVFIRNGEPEYTTEAVTMGTAVKEVSETGAVKISEQINLGFRYAGRIDQIYVKVGDQVELGQNLAKADTEQPYIELSESQAAFEVAQADYNKLLAGSSSEEIKVAEADVSSAQIALNNKKQVLEDVKADAEEDLNQNYQDSLDDLDDAYLKIYNAFNVASDVQREYFTGNDQEGVNVRNNKDVIENALSDASYYVNKARSGSQSDVEAGLLEVKSLLLEVRNALEVIRNMAETSLYRDTVTSADKTSLDTQKEDINTAYAGVVAGQQDISATKIANQTNINSAQADVATAEANLQKKQDELALKKAGPTQENINLYLAKIKQAQADVSLLQNKISEAVLRSPARGRIAAINKRAGETVQPTDSVVSLLPEGPFQVEADIYEEDIIDVKTDNPVRINLPAFSDQTFWGRVILIDPTEKLIDGVVYYEVNIIFDTFSESIKPGMTADIVIETAKKENVLIIPKGALKKINGENIVRVLEKGKAQERKIEIGLEGEEYIEVISGLAEGEQVIVSEKQK